jgi:hypothetical protein
MKNQNSDSTIGIFGTLMGSFTTALVTVVTNCNPLIVLTVVTVIAAIILISSIVK